MPGLRTTLVRNCVMAAIKRTIFLHKALAGQCFPDLSITIKFFSWRVVGANLFAHSTSYVRMNSHL